MDLSICRNAAYQLQLDVTTYSFDGHDWTSELSGHLKFLLLETDMVGNSPYWKCVNITTICLP